jgi:hypothetical protein
VTFTSKSQHLYNGIKGVDDMSNDVTFYLRIQTLIMVVMFSVVFKLLILYTFELGLLTTYFDPKTPSSQLLIVAIPDLTLVGYLIYAIIKDEQMNEFRLPYVLFDSLILVFAFLFSNLITYVIPFLVVVIVALFKAIF